MRPEARIAALEAEKAALREQVTALAAEAQELRARLTTATRDSHTSGKPPSSDALARRPRSLRKKRGKKRGKKPDGRLGQRGETRRLLAAPAAVVEQRPAIRARRRAPLGAEAPVLRHDRRQVQGCASSNNALRDVGRDLHRR